jgi:hypothetical protein
MTCSPSEACSPASADSTWDSNVRVCELCGSVSKTPSASESLRSTGLESRAIPTCAPLWPTPTANRRAGLQLHGRNYLTADAGCPCRCHTSTSSQAAFHAKTSAPPAQGQVSTAHVRVFGQSTPDSFASFDPGTSSWRTSQLCLDGELDVFSATWPRAGMTRNGIASRLQPLAPLTGGTVSGSLPTPNGRDWKDSGPSQGNRKSPNLGTVAHWPTPHGMPKMGQHRRPGPSGNELGHAVNVVERMTKDGLLTTPTADDTGYRKDRYSQGGTAPSTQIGGSLNPTWVEWLMGFPTEWTDLPASGTRSSRRSRSGSVGES